MKTKKVRKRRFNFLKFLTIMLFLYLIVMLVLNIIRKPIKNIIVLNNRFYTDEKIIETAKIDDYPSFFKSFSNVIEKRVKSLELVSDVKVSKNYLKQIVKIDVTEHKIIFKEINTNNYILSDKSVLKLDNVSGVPTLINFVPEDVKNKYIEKMREVDVNVISKISEIEYSPTQYDLERFLFYMTDGNHVYITLDKIEDFGKYIDIKKQLNGKKGILYLDSGNYLEVKE